MSSQSASYNKKSPTVKRILREASELASAPSPDYHAAPLESNLFEWHFTLCGPPSSPYESGIYHGRITLPPTYPLRPPSFRFLTPSGRFEVNREICLSISDHHEDTWQPAWGVRTAVVALRGFMESEAGGQVGGLQCSPEQRKQLAEQSRGWRCEGCGKTNEVILQESKDAAKEVGEARTEEATPAELKIGYKDEKKQTSDATSDVTASAASVPSPAAVNTQRIPPSLPPPVPPPVQTPVQPTGSAPPHVQPPVPVPQQAPLPEVETPWLDRIIWTFMALLLAVVLRRYLDA